MPFAAFAHMKDFNRFIVKIILHTVYTSYGEIHSSYLQKSEFYLGYCDFPRKMSSFKYIYEEQIAEVNNSVKK